MKERLFSYIVTALLSIITFLLGLVGFMTREAYFDLKQQIVTVQSTVGTMSEKIVRLETTVSERTKRK